MSRKRTVRFITTVLMLVTVMAASVAFVVPSYADEGPKDTTVSPVFWWWDAENPIGHSVLIRTGRGVIYFLETSFDIPDDIPTAPEPADSMAGIATTPWVVVFNKPNKCDLETKSTCNDQDVPNPKVKADFIYPQPFYGELKKNGRRVIGLSGRWVFRSSGHPDSRLLEMIDYLLKKVLLHQKFYLYCCSLRST